jgi:hypothetical protein
MPIEHEYKYILSDESEELMNRLEDKYPKQHIHQIYVTKNNRFRAIVKTTKKKTTAKWYHTFKKKINGEVLEIESEISSDDFDIIRQSENLGELHKIRFTIPQEHGQWDIDFLLTDTLINGGVVYFSCCECEQPKELDVFVPEILAKYIRYEVPHEHSGVFTNAKLVDQNYAKTVVENNLSLLKCWP